MPIRTAGGAVRRRGRPERLPEVSPAVELAVIIAAGLLSGFIDQRARPVAMMRSSRASCSFVPSARN
jgi:hypothetical protein